MESLFLIRLFAFLVLPLILAGVTAAIDPRVNTRRRRLEVFLTYMFAFSAAGGIAGGIGHLFASDLVAESIGWAPGSPFQLEMGFANLAVGVLAAIAVGRRDGFREATVVGGAILGVGAFTVHLLDIIQHGNLAPGNTLINISNLGRPVVLIYLLWALRRSEQMHGSAIEAARWHAQQAAFSGTAGALTGIGLGVGMSTAQPLFGLALGLIAGLALATGSRNRSRTAIPVAPRRPAGG